MRNRNGSITEAPRLVKELAGFGGKYLYFANAVNGYGPLQNRSTAGSFARQTGRLIITYPMIVSYLTWDIRIPDTYICRFVTAPDGTTSAFDINTSVTPVGPGTITITPTNGDFLLMPGLHYLQLTTHDAATVQWWDYNATNINYTYHTSLNVYYDTTQSDYTIPAIIYIRNAEFANMTEYAK